MSWIKRKNLTEQNRKTYIYDMNEVAKERFFFMSHGINGIK